MVGFLLLADGIGSPQWDTASCLGQMTVVAATFAHSHQRILYY